MIIRASYGIYGANIPALLRAFTAIMWLGIQTFAGSTALNILLLNMWPGWGEIGGEWNILGIHLSGLLSFVFFWAIHLLVLHHGMESIKRFEVWAGPLVYLVFGGMVWWAVDIAGGLGPIYSQPGKFHTFSETFWPFAAGVTGIIGIWATLILNIPDFTRFAETQKEQIKGQFYGLPGTFALFAFASITETILQKMKEIRSIITCTTRKRIKTAFGCGKRKNMIHFRRIEKQQKTISNPFMPIRCFVMKRPMIFR